MRARIILITILVLLIGAFAYASTFTLDKIEINGCIMSSEDEVRKELEEMAILDNTLLFYLQTKFQTPNEVPFVAKLDFEYVDKHEIHVDVYEKSVAGCIEYMESFVYFDKDGIVLETAKIRYDGVPIIKGLTITNWQIGEELPIENKKKFEQIMTVTQLVDKYKLEIQGIEFTSDGELVLKHDNIEIELGDGSNLAIQMMNLGSILEGLEGKTGVLYMKEFDSENSTASFKTK